MKNLTNEFYDKELHGRIKYITEFIDRNDIEGKNLLDIGCGFGWFEYNAIKNGVFEITGMEISEEDLSTIKSNISDNKLKLVVGSAFALPFSSNTFDTVVSWDVIEHLPRNTENKMFQEVSRVLKPGGAFYLSTPFDSCASKFLDPAWWLIGHRHYKEFKIKPLAAKFGFSTEIVSIKGGWYEILSILNLYISKWIFRRSPFLSDFFNKKVDLEYKKSSGFTSMFIKFRKDP